MVAKMSVNARSLCIHRYMGVYLMSAVAIAVEKLNRRRWSESNNHDKVFHACCCCFMCHRFFDPMLYGDGLVLVCARVSFSFFILFSFFPFIPFACAIGKCILLCFVVCALEFFVCVSVYFFLLLLLSFFSWFILLK